jgi:MFS family permease
VASQADSRVTRSSFIADLRSVLSERDFRRLFATRLVSQIGDGVFNAGFAAYAFFGAQTFPNPVAAVDAFAVLYLPYSLIGPFVGVFIDRWSRRQILVWSALIRACMVAVAALVVGSGHVGVPLYVSALAVLGVNRFFLSAVSAGVPHVVARDKLMMANAVAPTAGTIVGFVGGLAGLGVHLATGGGHIGSAATLLFGGACYVVAGLLGLRMRRDLLGPSRDTRGARAAGTATEIAAVLRGLAAGARHLNERRRAMYALGAIAVHRVLYGTLLVVAILLYRNYFYPSANGNAALGHGTLLVVASAIGYGAAALMTPSASRRIGKDAWIVAALAGGGIVEGIFGSTFSQVPFLIVAFALGVTAQGVKICVDTIVQQVVDDEYLGRVFSLYDMLFNTAYVLGPAIAAAFMPATGKSYPLVIVVAVGYLLAASVYGMLSRRAASYGRPSSESSSGSGGAPFGSAGEDGGTESPSPSAQPSSS